MTTLGLLPPTYTGDDPVTAAQVLAAHSNGLLAFQGPRSRDLLAALATGQKENNVLTIKREAFFVPETITAAALLKTMQANHVQIAVVIDEYGGIAGLVSVEDILEEIVGEIEDEHDPLPR